MLEDHVELASLELRFARQELRRRTMFLFGAILGGVSAFVLLHVAGLSILSRLGVPLYIPCLMLTLAYAIIAQRAFRRAVWRDPRVGEYFQATSQELNKSLQWTRQLFS